MKNQLYHYLSYFVLALIVVGCNSQKKEKKDANGEPNNTILKAGLLTSGKTYTMKIDSLGDIDWYALVVPKPGYVEVQTKKKPDNLDLRIRFAKKQAWKKQKQQWLSKDSELPIVIAVRNPDTLYFRIKDRYDKNDSDRPITFRAKFIEEFAPHEPNDKPDKATEVTTGQTVESYFYPKTDVDWFKTKVDSAGYLMVKARHLPKNLDIRVQYAQKPDEFSALEKMGKSKTLPAGIQVSQPGTYLIRLSDRYHSHAARDKAEWKVDFIPEMDTTEPNNKFEQAFPISLNDTVAVAIFPKGDVDYFTVTPNTSATVKMAAKKEGFEPRVHLYVKKDLKPTSVEAPKQLPAKFHLEKGKKYFIKLYDRYGHYYSQDPIPFYIFAIKEKKDSATEDS